MGAGMATFSVWEIEFYLAQRYAPEWPSSVWPKRPRLGRVAACHHGLDRGCFRLVDYSPNSGGATEPRSLLSVARVMPGGRPKVAHFDVFNTQEEEEN